MYYSCVRLYCVTPLIIRSIDSGNVRHKNCLRKMLWFSYKTKRLMLVRETVAVVASVTRNTQKHDVTGMQRFFQSHHMVHIVTTVLMGLQELVVISRALEHCFLESGARILVICKEPTCHVYFISQTSIHRHPVNTHRHLERVAAFIFHFVGHVLNIIVTSMAVTVTSI